MEVGFGMTANTTAILSRLQIQWRGKSFEADLIAMMEKLQAIQPFVYDCTRKSDAATACEWLDRFKDVLFLAENVVDEFELVNVRRKNRSCFNNRFFTCLPFGLSRQVKNIVSVLEGLQSDAYLLGLEDPHLGGSIEAPRHNQVRDPVPSAIVGRERDVSCIVELLCTRPVEVKDDLFIISIVGMGGIGKTTLARLISDNEIVSNDYGKKFWVTIGDDFDVSRIWKEMLQLLPEEMPILQDNEAILSMLLDRMRGEKILLVLDDVWEESYQLLGQLNLLQGVGSKISVIVTSRSMAVAKLMGSSSIYTLQGLSEDDSWSLFTQVAFLSRTMEEARELQAVAKEIVMNCHGIPLFIRTMAGLLQDKVNVSEWEKIAASEMWHSPSYEYMATLSFAFDCLPNALKQCFAYCSIFPKGTIMCKSDLIRLWLAQGYLSYEVSMSSSETGEYFFNMMLKYALLQVSKQDKDGNVIDCVMHDLVHDMAMHVSRHDNYMLSDGFEKGGCTPVKVRHLVISRNFEAAVEGFTRLRTIYSMVAMRNNMFSQARFLYVLKLDGVGLKELPKDFSMLKYLRYLDLSCNPIEYLPVSITRLYFLQTLLLRNCEKLLSLPEGLTKLSNLSHIEVPLHITINSVPPTADSTLPPINLDEERGLEQFRELGSLADIAGLLCISGVEYLMDKEAAQEARIGKMHRISGLELCWNRERQKAGDSQHNQDNNILDGLQPHPNIRSLKFINYDSQQFPQWVMLMKGVGNERLYRLVKIELVDCKRCLQLPTMGQLPCLRELLISGMDYIESIGQELYKYADDDEEGALEVCFPALTRLELRDFSKLRTWLPAPTNEKVNICQAFPALETLKVVNCPSLTSIPTDFPRLKNLLIQGIRMCGWLDTIIINSSRNHILTSLVLCMVSQLTHLPDELFHCTSLEILSLQKCEQLNSWPVDPWNLISLKELCINDCPCFIAPPHVDSLTALNTLVLRGCRGLTEAPRNLGKCKSLSKLAFAYCTNLETIPDLQQLTNLEEIDIIDCVQLRSLPAGLHGLPSLRIMRIGGVCNKFANFPECKSLERLWLKGMPDMLYLPQQLKRLSQLKVLRIKSFSCLEVVPDWISDLKNLEVLIFEECDNLKELPLRSNMLRLKKLRCLRIEKCATLEETFEEWKNSCPVPHIKINGWWHQGDRSSILQESHDIKARWDTIHIGSKMAEQAVGPAATCSDDEELNDKDFDACEVKDHTPNNLCISIPAQLILNVLGQVQGLDQVQQLKAVDLLKHDKDKFETLCELPQELKGPYIQMHLNDRK